MYHDRTGGTVLGMSAVLGLHPREIHDGMGCCVVLGIVGELGWVGSGI